MTEKIKAIWGKMIERADEDELPATHHLRLRAAEFKESAKNPDITARTMLGRWARANRAWCDYTGEDSV